MIKLVCVGKIKEKYLRDGIKYFSDTINKKVAFEIIEVDDIKAPENLSSALELEVKQKEGQKILSKISDKDHVVAFVIDGVQVDNKKMQEIVKDDVTFVIGGSLGLSDEVIKRANSYVSFSKMTFTHQLMRLMVVEVISDSV